MVRLVSLFILLVLILFLGATFYQVIAPFLMPLFLAAVLAVLCQPLFRYFARRFHGRTRLAAAITTAAVLAMILIPLSVGTFIGSVQLYGLVQRGFENRTFHHAAAQVRKRLNIDALAEYLTVPGQAVLENAQPAEPGVPAEGIPSAPGSVPAPPPFEALQDDGVVAAPPGDLVDPGEVVPPPIDALESGDVTQLREREIHAQLEGIRQGIRLQLLEVAERSLGALGRSSLGLAGRTVSTTVGIITGIVTGIIAFLMFVIALYYFLADGPALLAAGEGLIPVHAAYQRRLLTEFEKVIRAVVLATFLAGLGQALATAGALYVFGFHHFFFLFIVSSIVALVPLAGTWLVWGPCAIWLAMDQQYGSAIMLTLYGVIVVGLLDNLIRTYVLHSDAKLHPLLAFVSVLGGIQAMGLWGVFIGPIVASCLYALVQVFNLELKEFSKARLTSAMEGEGVPTSSEPLTAEPTAAAAAAPEIAAAAAAPAAKEVTRPKSRRQRRKGANR